ncbi:MAG: type II secretion system protein [Elusimicrobia bacterium]|nr:type II secretion system protein [Elusimicrobiota bacterium]
MGTDVGPEKQAVMREKYMEKKRRTMGIYRGISGFSLVELVVAAGIFSVIVLVLAVLMLSMAKGLVKSREQAQAHRLARTIRVQLDSMRFGDIFSCDSGRPFFGLTPVAGGGLHSEAYRQNVADPFSFYPSSRTLLAMHHAALSAGFSKFELGVTFLRRDRSAVRAAGITKNVIPFTDTDNSINPNPPVSLAAYTGGDGYDDYDPMIRYTDYNNDGDYFDQFFLGWVPFNVQLPGGCIWFSQGNPNSLMGCQNRASLPANFVPPLKGGSLTEMPDTRLKQVNLRLWNNRGELVHREGWVISEGGFSGAKIDDWESILVLDVKQPVVSTILYSYITNAQQDSHDLPISQAYPATPPALRADAQNLLVIQGETAPLAQVHFTTNPAFINGVFTPMDSGVANQDGLFSVNANDITAALVEGRNIIGGITEKNGERSPIWSAPFIYDLRPPYFLNADPPDNAHPIRTRTPFLGIQLLDDTINTPDVSGIDREVISVSTKDQNGNYSSTQFLFRDGWANYGNDWLVVASTTSGLIDPLPDNSWISIKVEGGDYAHYKTSATWRVKINVVNNDISTPTIKVPNLGTDGCSVVVTANVPEIVCDLNDPDSGINWRSINLRVNSGPVVQAPFIAKVNRNDTPRMGDYFNPRTIVTGGRLTYRFPGPIPIGLYSYDVSVKNWDGDDSLLPPQNFNVP